MRAIQKKGVTLTGLLFGSGVAVAFVMPMMPAVNRAREADDRSQCRILTDEDFEDSPQSQKAASVLSSTISEQAD